MRKIGHFMRSMRFGMVLLGLIALLSIIGTLVPQEQSAAYYTQTYGSLGHVITALGVDHLYTAWLYQSLYVFLCLNLLCCSVLRARKSTASKAVWIKKAQAAAPLTQLDAGRVSETLPRMGFRQIAQGVYARRLFGAYGSLITHAGLLLLMIAAACAFGLEQRADYAVKVHEQIELQGGTVVRVDGFEMEDETGKLAYKTSLTLLSASGEAEQHTELLVNHPVKVGQHTIYQQNYYYEGVLGIRVGDGENEYVELDAPAFLSLDGENGIQYMAVYTDYIEEEGQILPVSTRDGRMKNPTYLVAVLEDGKPRAQAIRAGDELEVSGVTYTFLEPTAYPGLRVKTQPNWVLPLLYTSFALLLAGLYLCFFYTPQVLSIQDGQVRAASPKDMQELIEQIEERMKKETEGC